MGLFLLNSANRNIRFSYEHLLILLQEANVALNRSEYWSKR